MPFLITWGAWIGVLWVVLCAVLVFRVTAGKAKFDPERDEYVRSSLFSRRSALRLVASVIPGLAVLWVAGALGYEETSSSPHSGQGVLSVPIEDSLLVQLAACSPFHRPRVLGSLQSNFRYYVPATEQAAQRSVALAGLRGGCVAAQEAALSHRIPMPDSVDCEGQEPLVGRCTQPNFAVSLMAGDETSAITAAHARSELMDGEQKQKWECIALGLEARLSDSFDALRAEESPFCRLVLATLVQPNEAHHLITLEGLVTSTALRREQGPLILTLLATGSPEEAAEQFTHDQVRAWLGQFRIGRYQPGVAAALRAVEAVGERNGVEAVSEGNGRLRLLRALLQAGVGLNAFATVHLDQAAIALERASSLLLEAREELEGERERARVELDQQTEIPAAWYPLVSRIRQDSRVNYTFEISEFFGPSAASETPFGRVMYPLLQSSAKLQMSERMEEYINEWRAVIVLIKTGEGPAPELLRPRRNGHDWLDPEWLESRPLRWSTHPRLVNSVMNTSDPNPDLIHAIESGDGEQIALTLDYFSEGPERFHGAFAAATGENQSVLSTHWRYVFRFVMCDGNHTQRRLINDLVLAHILHDDAWIDALRERQTAMNVHREDMLLSVAYW